MIRHSSARTHRRQHTSLNKTVVLLTAILLLAVAAVGSTVAWLMAETETPAVNTFTPSKIGVELKETTTEYQMIPGHTIAKDPKAWITEGSEAAYLFVQVEESANFNEYMGYAIAEGWIPMADTNNDGKSDNGVYYREVPENTTTQYPILANNQVLVSGDVTMEMMNDLYDGSEDEPTLTFTAYAHQLYRQAGTKFTPADAWDNLNPSHS